MAVLEILRIPDERLKRPSEPVEHFDDALRAFIADLEETRRHGPGAVGIAAPQVGCFQRIVIVDVSNTRKPVPNHGHMVLVNPEIVHWEGYEMGREGCLSVPDYTGNVIRATHIRLKARDPHGAALEYTMEGFEARALQHEIDHLDGTLFIDRVVSRRTDLFRRKVYQKGGAKD
ncbi:MAG: peptide deformylase [Candidatus Sedimenticola endophacoides]|uniref:Peptide deformylase n=1 Tax=Candidatus Sedimenticola endophacoides TaxID=2548426 RepID=A0A657PZ93_9GAMM|nr:MAG: peptide deformylase [Candidatus Sedimenticola endophacoides]OQX33164.1 MAG: peptide deformylase [Candidatus Sedimenticola endophacoides]OQX35574.1 MAG: peptide deformylase [Candidatus Sedimenticola endophacoides]OQX38983.1 MAG: peptide deformylase [Candidatus Sedimenticola endophacoides]OQX39864.1 MAG: peptide deformylase [Candidatus Sedimenticola endophacoides]